MIKKTLIISAIIICLFAGSSRAKEVDYYESQVNYLRDKINSETKDEFSSVISEIKVLGNKAQSLYPLLIKKTEVLERDAIEYIIWLFWEYKYFSPEILQLAVEGIALTRKNPCIYSFAYTSLYYKKLNEAQFEKIRTVVKTGDYVQKIGANLILLKAGIFSASQINIGDAIKSIDFDEPKCYMAFFNILSCGSSEISGALESILPQFELKKRELVLLILAVHSKNKSRYRKNVEDINSKLIKNMKDSDMDDDKNAFLQLSGVFLPYRSIINIYNNIRTVLSGDNGSIDGFHFLLFLMPRNTHAKIWLKAIKDFRKNNMHSITESFMGTAFVNLQRSRENCDAIISECIAWISFENKVSDEKQKIIDEAKQLAKKEILSCRIIAKKHINSFIYLIKNAKQDNTKIIALEIIKGLVIDDNSTDTVE